MLVTLWCDLHCFQEILCKDQEVLSMCIWILSSICDELHLEALEKHDASDA